jgi:hypothetical protein
MAKHKQEDNIIPTIIHMQADIENLKKIISIQSSIINSHQDQIKFLLRKLYNLECRS